MNWYDWLNPGQHAWGDYFIDFNRRALERYPDSRWARQYRSDPWNQPGFASVDKSTANKYLYRARDIPFIGGLLQASDRERQMEDYMRFYGLDWSDMKYPTLQPGPGLYGSAGRLAVSALLTKGFYR